MKLEICIESISAAQAALACGADRLEVCDGLAVGGITPNVRLVEQCKLLPGSNLMVMIRPHVRSFVYSQEDLKVMLNDVRVAKQIEVQGVVFGALTAEGRVDHELCLRLIDAARPLDVTFHRAFDLAREPIRALDALVDLGFERVLTSGQAATAVQGAETLKRLVQHAGEKISVIVAGNVRAENIQQLLMTGAAEFHSSARKLASIEPLGSANENSQAYEVDEAEVLAMVQTIHRGF